ncbi:MAG TPA: NAD(P)-binding domain-containing protein, partial [Chloroflexota bacterium]|nr:NAD(P)-binding domain-containing protein [Chloroflexota bacterium]
MTQSLRVGFVGLGTMGTPMARCLLRLGFPLTVYDVRAAAAAELAREGATAASSAKEVAASS